MLRNCSVDLIWERTADYYGVCTNVFAEVNALIQGLERCLAGGFLQADIESDSLILVQLLKLKLAPAWSVCTRSEEFFVVDSNGLSDFSCVWGEHYVYKSRWLVCLIGGVGITIRLEVFVKLISRVLQKPDVRNVDSNKILGSALPPD